MICRVLPPSGAAHSTLAMWGSSDRLRVCTTYAESLASLEIIFEFDGDGHVSVSSIPCGQNHGAKVLDEVCILEPGP